MVLPDPGPLLLPPPNSTPQLEPDPAAAADGDRAREARTGPRQTLTLCDTPAATEQLRRGSLLMHYRQPNDTAPFRVMAVKAYSRTQAKFWYVDFTIISHTNRCDLQLPDRRGVVKSVNHVMNLQDLISQLFKDPSTLEDLGITEECSKQIMTATID